MYNHYLNNSVRRLSKDEVIQLAPSVLTVEPHSSLSKRYSPISTMDIIDILEQDGWYPVKAEEVAARTEHTQGFQKHMIRFQHNNLKVKEENFEAVLNNSHDGKSRYHFLLGIWRLICSNGLIVGDTFNQISLKHVGLEQNQVIDASRRMINFVPQLADSVQEMKQLELSENERRIYAQSASMLFFPKIENPREIPVAPKQFLRARRTVDMGKNDLWTTYNNVQENMMKGGLSFHNEETKRNQSTRKIKAINKNVNLNRALWNLTERMRELKLEG